MSRYPGMFSGATGRDVEAAVESEFPSAVPSTSRGQVAEAGVEIGTGGEFRGGIRGGESSSGVVSPPRRRVIGPTTTMSARKRRLRKMLERASTRRLGGDVRPESAQSSPRGQRVARSPPTTGRSRNDQRGSAGVVGERDRIAQRGQPAAREGQGDPRRQRAPGNVPRGHPARDIAGSVNAAQVAGAIRQARSRASQRRGPAVKFLQYFLAFLYYIGMSPVKPASAKKLPRIIRWIQAAFFWFGSLMAVLDASAEVKTSWIQFGLKEDKETFVLLAFYLANWLTRIYYIWLFASSSSAISQLLEKIRNVNPKTTSSSREWPVVIGIGVGTLSILLSGAFTLFGAAPLNNWSLQKSVFLKAYEFSENLFLWSSDNKTYDDTTFKLWLTYATAMTPETQALAVLGNIVGYFGTLHSCILLDLFLIVSIQISALERQLSKNMKKATQNRPGGCPLSENWVEYKRLRDVCDESDNVFGNLLELVHIQNLLHFCYFLLELLNKDSWSIYPFIDLMSVTKICITYYLAQKTAETNKTLDACVVNGAGGAAYITIGGEEHYVVVLRDIMREHPIGVGRGEFFIDKGFVRRFAGFVGSVFMLLAGNLK